jgi:hypothetical protein
MGFHFFHFHSLSRHRLLRRTLAGNHLNSKTLNTNSPLIYPLFPNSNLKFPKSLPQVWIGKKSFREKFLSSVSRFTLSFFLFCFGFCFGLFLCFVSGCCSILVLFGLKMDCEFRWFRDVGV